VNIGACIHVGMASILTATNLLEVDLFDFSRMYLTLKYLIHILKDNIDEKILEVGRNDSLSLIEYGDLKMSGFKRIGDEILSDITGDGSDINISEMITDINEDKESEGKDFAKNIRVIKQ
ncbi:hypothetical protein ACJX0J_020795, partial [Zea mays]